MSAKNFSLGQILSVTHDRLLCDISGVYEILNFMTGDNLFTHQLPRAGRECKPWLLEQHPDLAGVDVSDISHDNWRERLAQLTDQYGETRAVSPVPDGEHERIDPLSELAEKVHPDKIVVVETK